MQPTPPSPPLSVAARSQHSPRLQQQRQQQQEQEQHQHQRHEQRQQQHHQQQIPRHQPAYQPEGHSSGYFHRRASSLLDYRHYHPQQHQHQHPRPPSHDQSSRPSRHDERTSSSWSPSSSSPPDGSVGVAVAMAHAPLPSIQHFDGHAPPRPQHHLPSRSPATAAAAPPPPPAAQDANHPSSMTHPAHALPYSSSSAHVPPPHHHSSQSQHPHHAHLGAPPPANNSSSAPPAPSPYQSQTPYAYHNGTAMLAPHLSAGAAVAGGMRYPLAQHVSMERSLSAGRHKKEIKRRTKTGCLTCRKRRIKCDEGHPTCRNCAKSKRECLGYDPIFKQNHLPSPTHQPAHLSLIPQPPIAPSAASSLSLAPAAVQPPSHHALPPPTGSHHHPSLSGSGPGAHSYLPTPAPWPAYIPPSVRDSHGSYTSASSLDPALAGSHHASTMSAYGQSSPTLQSARKVLPIPMEELFSLSDVAPQFQRRDPPPAPSPDMQQAVADFYRYHFAPGLDFFLDTDWYTRASLVHLQQHPALHDFVSQCVVSFRARTTDANVERAIASLEARLIWQLACLPRIAARGPAAREPAVQELLPRLDVLENLLTGQFLEPHRTPLAPQPVLESESPEKLAVHKEQKFWYQLGRFVSARDDDASDARAAQEIDAALDTIRNMLGPNEAHDVLYSLAVGRNIGGRVAEFVPPHPLPGAANNDPKDKVNRLRVAYSFLDTRGRTGSTQIVKAVCNIALRSWTLQKRGA